MTTTQTTQKIQQNKIFSGIGKQKTCAQAFRNQTDVLLYSVTTYQGTSLQKTQTSIYPTGQIAYNPNNVRRIDIVKELMDTWFTLSRTLIATAKISNLKPEFTMQLSSMIEQTTLQKETIKSKVIQQDPILRATDDNVSIPVDDLNESFHSFVDQISPLKAFELPKIKTPVSKQSQPTLTHEQQTELFKIDLQMKQLALQTKQIKLKTQEKRESLLLIKLEHEITTLQSRAKKEENEAKKVYVEAAATLAKHEIEMTRELNRITKASEQRIQTTKEKVKVFNSEENRWVTELVETDEIVPGTATNADLKLQARLEQQTAAITSSSDTLAFEKSATVTTHNIGPKLTPQQLKTIEKAGEKARKLQDISPIEEQLSKYGWGYESFQKLYDFGPYGKHGDDCYTLNNELYSSLQPKQPQPQKSIGQRIMKALKH